MYISHKAFLLAAAACSASAAPLQAANSCSVSINTQCFPDLASAVSAAPDGSTITVSQNITVPIEVAFDKNLSFVGQGSPRPTISTNMNVVEGAILRATGTNNQTQTVLLYNLAFESNGVGYSSAFRTTELGNGEYPTQPTSFTNLSISSCSFKNFYQLSRGGSAVFVGMPSGLVVTNSEFINNTVARIDTLRWEGGGAFWVADLEGPATITNNRFENNTHLYQHGCGGAFMVNYASDNMTISNNYFVRNSAPGGGAVYIGTVDENATTIISNTQFVENNATEFGWGSRGGAMWVQYVAGNLTVNQGTKFVGNMALADRGAAIANNKIYSGAIVVLQAEFANNTCSKGAFAFDAVSDDAFTDDSLLVLMSGSTFKSNTGAEGKDWLVRIETTEEKNVIHVYGEDWKGKTMAIHDS